MKSKSKKLKGLIPLESNKQNFSLSLSLVKIQKTSSLAGFTFIELLISLGIFAMITIVIIGVYMNITKTIVENQAQIELGRDGQNILNSIVRDIRKGDLRYDLYGNQLEGNNPKTVPVLYLKETSNATTTVTYITYRSCTSTEGISQVQRCYKKSPDDCNLNEPCDTELDFVTMNSPWINADRLDFHINPNFDPFVEPDEKRSHPRITTVIKLRSRRPTKQPQELILEQTDYQKPNY